MGAEPTVFVVDDDPGVRSSLRALACSAGLAVETYASGREFLAAYDPGRAGCLLLDVQLRESNGLEVQDALRRRHATLPVIVLTGHASVPTSVQAFKAGAIDFLEKPVPPRKLLERIRAAIDIDQHTRETQMVTEQRERPTNVGALTAKIIHDLGNPLAALSMQAQLILRHARRNDPVATVIEPAQCILGTLDRLHALVAEFSSFSRERRLDLQVVSVSQFLQGLIDLWKPLTTARTIDLSLEIPEPVPFIRADAQRLRRVFDNLIKNAVEAIEPGPGRITLRGTVPAADSIRLSVEDTGPGISDGLDVFDLFETTKAGGTGLGLAVAKQIVLAHGGSITYESLVPHGTVFHVDLPQQWAGHART